MLIYGLNHVNALTCISLGMNNVVSWFVSDRMQLLTLFVTSVAVVHGAVINWGKCVKK